MKLTCEVPLIVCSINDSWRHENGWQMMSDAVNSTEKKKKAKQATCRHLSATEILARPQGAT
jgi:hypothetical protein